MEAGFTTVRDLRQAVPDLVGAELVPLQIEQPAATGLPVQQRRSGGAGQPQSPGGHRTGQSAGEPDLGVLRGENWQRTDRRPAAADGPAVDPHEGPGCGAAAGRFVVLIDGSGYLVFGCRHCDHCLTQRHGETTLYMHQVLEAKVLGPAGTVVSIATEFIDNRDVQGAPTGASQERVKQDCELKALRRLMVGLRGEFPQLRICLGGDSLYACGAGFQIAKDYKCDYIYVFKPGRLPALWQDFQGLLRLCPDQQVDWTTPQGVRQVYRWVNGLHYTDSDGRESTFNAIACTETNKEKEKSAWSLVTSLDVNHETVVEVATQGGRERWRTENERFNTQKNSGLNLEHAYSHTCWAAYYFLLQIAHLLLQLLEKGSLLRQLAQEQGKRSAVELFGSLKNMAQRLLDSLRYWTWPAEAFDAAGAGAIQIRLDSS